MNRQRLQFVFLLAMMLTLVATPAVSDPISVDYLIAQGVFSDETRRSVAETIDHAREDQPELLQISSNWREKFLMGAVLGSHSSAFYYVKNGVAQIGMAMKVVESRWSKIHLNTGVLLAFAEGSIGEQKFEPQLVDSFGRIPETSLRAGLSRGFVSKGIMSSSPYYLLEVPDELSVELEHPSSDGEVSLLPVLGLRLPDLKSTDGDLTRAKEITRQSKWRLVSTSNSEPVSLTIRVSLAEITFADERKAQAERWRRSTICQTRTVPVHLNQNPHHLVAPVQHHDHPPRRRAP